MQASVQRWRHLTCNTHAAILNLIIGAFRRAGYANIVHACRWHARDEQRILALDGYT